MSLIPTLVKRPCLELLAVGAVPADARGAIFFFGTHFFGWTHVHSPTTTNKTQNQAYAGAHLTRSRRSGLILPRRQRFRAEQTVPQAGMFFCEHHYRILEADLELVAASKAKST